MSLGNCEGEYENRTFQGFRYELMIKIEPTDSYYLHIKTQRHFN